MQRNLILIKLNQVVCEYFLPSVFAKINELNAHYKRLGMTTQDEQRQATSDKQELQNQIAEENQFVLMCRDYVDLIRVFVNFNNQGTSSSVTTTAVNEDDIEDENEVQTEIVLNYLIFNLFKTLL